MPRTGPRPVSGDASKPRTAAPAANSTDGMGLGGVYGLTGLLPLVLVLVGVVVALVLNLPLKRRRPPSRPADYSWAERMREVRQEQQLLHWAAGNKLARQKKSGKGLD